MKKIKELIKSKKIMTLAMTLCMIFCMTAICCATETADYGTLITQLNDGLGASAFIGVVGDVLPYIITVTIVALVWYLIKRAIKKFSKGKPGV